MQEEDDLVCVQDTVGAAQRRFNLVRATPAIPRTTGPGRITFLQKTGTGLTGEAAPSICSSIVQHQYGLGQKDYKL